jgi:hypothetical protein
MKNIFCLLFAVVALTSCSNDVQTNTPAFQAKNNGVIWHAKDARAVVNADGSMTITALTQYETITMELASDQPGTYQLGTTNTSNFVSYDFVSPGVDLSYTTSSTNPGPVYKIANIVSGGTTYTNSNNALTTGGSGSGLKVAITTNAGGAVTSADIVSRGDGYVAGDVVTIVGGNDLATLRILNTQQSNGEVTIEKAEGGKFTGTFKFNAVSATGEVITFSSGVFYQISAAGL